MGEAESWQKVGVQAGGRVLGRPGTGPGCFTSFNGFFHIQTQSQSLYRQEIKQQGNYFIKDQGMMNNLILQKELHTD